MSSENKKSLTSFLIPLLLFVLIAGGSWFFFSGKSDKLAGVKDGLDTQISQAIEGGDDIIEKAKDSHAGHDHDSHGKEAETVINASDVIGTKGKIHQLNQAPIYGHRGVGNPNAPVKIREFFSLTCNHCAEFHKGAYQDVKKNLIDTGQVYFIYEEFPLNGPALYGSMIARCLPEERYSGFIDILLRTQDKWAFGGDFKSALMQNAGLAGMSEEEFNSCFNNKELQKAVASNIKDASDIWKVNSTPSFVVNDGERILYGSQSYEKFEALVKQLTNNTETSLVPAPQVADTPALKETIKSIEIAPEASEAIVQEIVPEVTQEIAPVKESGDKLQNAIEKSMDIIEDNLE